MKDRILQKINDIKSEISALHLMTVMNRANDDSETAIWLSTNAFDMLEEPLLKIEKIAKELKCL